MKENTSLLLIILILFFSCNNSNEHDLNSSSPSNSNIDIAESNITNFEIVIGSQIWMSRNLDVDKFRNGDFIPQAKSNGEWKAYG